MTRLGNTGDSIRPNSKVFRNDSDSTRLEKWLDSPIPALDQRNRISLINYTYFTVEDCCIFYRKDTEVRQLNLHKNDACTGIWKQSCPFTVCGPV